MKFYCCTDELQAFDLIKEGFKPVEENEICIYHKIWVFEKTPELIEFICPTC